MSWRFLRSPKWIVRHVLVALLVAGMIGAGFWQLDRLDQKRDRNALIEARQEADPEPIGDLLDAAADVDDPAVEAVLHRRAVAEGTYVDQATVVVENRSQDGFPGAWVLTPLDLGDGTGVLVNRGFVGFGRDGRIQAPPAPSGPVLVEGLVQESQERGRFGPRDAEEGTLATVARVDVARIDAQVDLDLLPAYLQRTASDPPEPDGASDRPGVVPVPPPELDEGPHLGYAFQWFTFTAIALIGYPILLRRVARDEHRRRVREARAAETAPA